MFVLHMQHICLSVIFFPPFFPPPSVDFVGENKKVLVEYGAAHDLFFSFYFFSFFPLYLGFVGVEDGAAHDLFILFSFFFFSFPLYM